MKRQRFSKLLAASNNCLKTQQRSLPTVFPEIKTSGTIGVPGVAHELNKPYI
jgi:hypothetical protein